MENIDKLIIQTQSYLIWDLCRYVNSSAELNKNEKDTFNEIWKDAENFIFHNYSQPQNTGVKYITEKYKLSEKAANQIVLSLHYLLK